MSTSVNTEHSVTNVRPKKKKRVKTPVYQVSGFMWKLASAQLKMNNAYCNLLYFFMLEGYD